MPATTASILCQILDEKVVIDGIQYSGATVAFLGPTHRFLSFYGVLPGDVLMF